MNWELMVVLALASVILVYAIRHISKAIKDLKRELGE